MNWLIGIFIFFPILITGQNIVNNAGFEEADNCTGNSKDLHNWYGVDGRLEYYHKCNGVIKNFATGPKYSTPEFGNPPEKQEPSCVGLTAYWPKDLIAGLFNWDNRNFIQSKLITPVMKNHIYCIKLKIALSQYSDYAITGLGVAFTKNKITMRPYKPLKIHPQVTSNENILLDNSNKWVEISMIFKANETDSFITIGNFKSNAKTKKKKIKLLYQSDHSSYYFIDDVSVMEIKDSSMANCNKNHISNRTLYFHKDGTYKNDIGYLNIFFNDTYFQDGGEFYFNMLGKDSLEVLYRVLVCNKKAKIIITGYSDSVIDNKKRKFDLFQSRADAVRVYLTGAKINANSIIINKLIPNDSDPKLDQRLLDGNLELRVVFN
jgi:OmpA-OmpF porin, OOP family